MSGKKTTKDAYSIWTKAILPIFIVIIFFTICYFLKEIFVSLLLAFIVAYVFNPVINLIERCRLPFTRKHISRGFGIIFIIFFGLICITGVLTYAIPRTVDGLYTLGNTIRAEYPKYQETVDNWIRKYENTEIGRAIKAEVKARFKRVEPAKEKEDVKKLPSGETAPSSEKQLSEAVQMYKKYLPWVVNFSLNIIKKIFYSTFGFAGIVINFIVFSVVSVYLLKDFNRIVQSVKTAIPVSKQDKVMKILNKVNDNLKNFLQGQIIICLILSLIYSIGLTIAGIPLAFPVGFFGGIGNLIPYVGTGTGIILSSVIAFLQYQDIKHIVYVIIVFSIGQLLEATVITPKIMGEGLGLSPVIVILSIMIFGQLFGFLGLLLAVPIVSVLKVFFEEFLVQYKSSHFYTG